MVPPVTIPIRTRKGEPPVPFRPEDVILNDGDILYVRARELELFYTAGLIPPGEYILPRDYDLDVVEALARVRGPMVNGAFAQNNLSGNILAAGIGSPSPSLVNVLRKTRGGGQVNIRVDLNSALRDRRERVIVQAGDVLVLQETVGEALTRYFTTNVNFRFMGFLINRRDATLTNTISVPGFSVP
jgi:hypothetical protein